MQDENASLKAAGSDPVYDTPPASRPHSRQERDTGAPLISIASGLGPAVVPQAAMDGNFAGEGQSEGGFEYPSLDHFASDGL